MKYLLMLLTFSALANTNVDQNFETLKKHYDGKKTVQKLNKIIYIRRAAIPTSKFNNGCHRLRSKSPAWVCSMTLGYARFCFWSSVYGATRVSCKAYDDEGEKNRRFGTPDYFVSEDT